MKIDALKLNSFLSKIEIGVNDPDSNIDLVTAAIQVNAMAQAFELIKGCNEIAETAKVLRSIANSYTGQAVEKAGKMLDVKNGKAQPLKLGHL